MSGANSDQLHRSTLSVYANLMEQFNPGLQTLVTLGNSYVKAFQALAVTSEAYFSAVAKMGEQALHTLSSRSLGDVLVQISETQRRLTAEMEGVIRWFQVEVLQAMEKNVKLDEEYIDGSRRVYELEVRNQAEALERQLRRGAFRDSLEHSEYMQYLRQSQHDIMKEEERRSVVTIINTLPTQLLLEPLLIHYQHNYYYSSGLCCSNSQGWFPAAYVSSIEEFSNLLGSSGTSLRSHSMNNLLDPSDTSMGQSEKAYGDVAPPTTPTRRASVDLRPISPLPERRAEPEIVTRTNSLKGYNELPPPPPPPPPPPHPTTMLRRGSADFRPIQPTFPERTSESLSPLGASGENLLFPRGTNPFATVKLKPTTTNDRSAPRTH
nr:brain-specific angiogenesis inhibitor 1-associated protein 2-like protein 2 [Oncorhynchus nerka]